MLGEKQGCLRVYRASRNSSVLPRIVNIQLAKALDYDPDRSLVQEALREIAKCLAKGESRTLPRRTAQEVVDQLLPNRSFANSLYLGLVNEGVLFEDIDWRKENGKEKVTSIAYERFADHIIVETICFKLISI